MRILIAIIALLTLGASAHADTPKAHQLSPEASLVLNYGATRISSGKRWDKRSTTTYVVPSSAYATTMYGHFCSGDRLFLLSSTELEARKGFVFNPVCKVRNTALKTESYGVYRNVFILQNDRLVDSWFTTDWDDPTKASIAESDEHPVLRLEQAQPIDSIAVDILISPPQLIAETDPGTAIVKLFIVENAANLGSNTPTYSPIIAVREIIPPFRHTAYQLSISASGFANDQPIRMPTPETPDQHYLMAIWPTSIEKHGETIPCSSV